MPVFFTPLDYKRYQRILGERARKHELRIWAYCLMPNHVHLVVVPATPAGLSRPIGETHRQYAFETNRRMGWSGHLWQERFFSSPMDEVHLVAAARYVLLNPVRAGLCDSANDWPYSSARAQIHRTGDHLADTAPLDRRITDWQRFLESPDENADREIRSRTRGGWPLGSPDFVAELEGKLGRRLRALPPGPAKSPESP